MPAAPQQKAGLIAVPLAISTLAYFSLINNYFAAGDFHNFYLFLNDGLPEFLLAPHGGHLLVTRNFIWWLLYQVVGMQAEVYFATVLVTHLIAVGLLFEATRRLTHSAAAATITASLWGSTAVQEGTLGWYSVYGQVLATAIFAWLLYRLARTAEGSPLERATLLRWGLLIFAAVTSFGVGIGMALVFPLVAYLMLPPSRERNRAVLVLTALAMIVPILYRTMLLLYDKLYGPTKELGMVYVGLRLPGTVLKLLAYLVGDGVVALLGAGFVTPGSIPISVTAAVAAAYFLVLLVVFYGSTTAERRIMLAAWVFCLACYGIIALGRAPYYLKGSIDVVAHATRYHYAGTLALALLTAAALARLAAWMSLGRIARLTAVAAFAGALVLCQLRWGPAIDHHPAERKETSATIAAIQKAVDAAPPGADVYIENRRFTSIGPILNRRMDLFPGWAGVFVIFFPDNVVDGRRVYFVSAPEVVTKMRPGSRVASLLVTPEQREKTHATGAARAATLVTAQQSEQQPR